MSPRISFRSQADISIDEVESRLHVSYEYFPVVPETRDHPGEPSEIRISSIRSSGPFHPLLMPVTLPVLEACKVKLLADLDQHCMPGANEEQDS